MLPLTPSELSRCVSDERGAGTERSTSACDNAWGSLLCVCMHLHTEQKAAGNRWTRRLLNSSLAKAHHGLQVSFSVSDRLRDSRDRRQPCLSLFAKQANPEQLSAASAYWSANEATNQHRRAILPFEHMCVRILLESTMWGNARLV